MSAVSDLPQICDVSAQSKSKYRPEIDGLRAFAVIAVIINHFNKDLLPSGYLGVDIFFVISGYVITSSLSGRESKSFGDFLSGFYARRVKRLVPALATYVIIASVLICMVNPNPGTYLLTGIFSLFGASNIFLFLNSTDYFAQAAELNPFTHTWSLGVEEQFYLLFPFLIWFSGFGRQAKKGARNLFALILTLTVTSVVGFIFFYQFNQPAAYFLMPTRFWELAVGCLIFIGFQQQVKLAKTLEQLPPLLIVPAMLGVMFLPLAAAVPATILIVLLSAVLIVCLKSGTAAFIAFTNKGVVHIGLISYSLYLWHWGVLVTSRWSIGVYWWSAPLQIMLMTLIASISYAFIESPMRRRENLKRFSALAFGIILPFLGVIVVLAINGARRQLFLSDSSVYQDNQLYRFLDLKGKTRSRLIVLGDSHAGAIGALLEDLNTQYGFAIKLHARGEGIAGIDKSNPDEFIVKALESYAGTIGAKDVVVIVTNYQHVTGGLHVNLVNEEKAAVILRLRKGKLVLFRPIPYFEKLRPYRECYNAWFRPFVNSEKNCVVSRDRTGFASQFRSVILAQNELRDKYRGTVYLFDAFSELCPSSASRCVSADGKVSFFKDVDHISSHGARKMKKSFLSMLHQILALNYI
jgi:peptidoglycan/LPS O-acetylase OafA/YrhL